MYLKGRKLHEHIMCNRYGLRDRAIASLAPKIFGNRFRQRLKAQMMIEDYQDLRYVKSELAKYGAAMR